MKLCTLEVHFRGSHFDSWSKYNFLSRNVMYMETVVILTCRTRKFRHNVHVKCPTGPGLILLVEIESRFNGKKTIAEFDAQR